MTNKSIAGVMGKKIVGAAGIDAILNGLGELVDKLAHLENIKEASSSTSPRAQGIYGVSIKMGIGGQGGSVETFGNVKQDESGQAVVHEVREPLCDVFEEPGVVLVVAEMPGIHLEDLQLELDGDLLTIRASRRDRQYQKELQLPCPVELARAQRTANNGVIEIRFPL